MFLTCCSLGLQAGNLGHDLGQGVPRVRQRGGHRLKLNYKKHQVKQTPCWPTPSRSAVSQATPSCPSASRTKPSCPEVSPRKVGQRQNFCASLSPAMTFANFLGKQCRIVFMVSIFAGKVHYKCSYCFSKYRLYFSSELVNNVKKT